MINVLFDLKKEYYFNSLEPLYLEMAKDPRYSLWIRVGRDQKSYFKLIHVSEKRRIAGSLESRGFQVTDRTSGFDVVVCGDALSQPERFGDVLRIHVDHGVGIKTLRIRNIVRQPDFRYHVFLEGKYWHDYICSLGWQDKAEFYITGLPKLDPFFWKGHYKPGELKAGLGLDPEKPTVLFAPSYRPSCIGAVKEKVADLIPRYNVVVKLHPYSWGGKYAPHSHHRFYERLAARHRELFLIPSSEYDIYPYLVMADTLISDTSSVINEFLALGKHGIIYVLSHDRLVHSDGMPILSIDPRDWLKDSFVHLERPQDLTDAVESALHPTKKMESSLKRDRAHFFTGLDGKAGKRVKAEIDRLAGP